MKSHLRKYSLQPLSELGQCNGGEEEDIEGVADAKESEENV